MLANEGLALSVNLPVFARYNAGNLSHDSRKRFVMFAFTFFPATHPNSASRLRLTVPLLLSVWGLAGVPLVAQTAHFGGAIVTLGSGFVTPTCVAIDGSGNVFVADEGNNAVKEMLAVNGRIPASPVINTVGSGFVSPTCVSLDGSGNVFVNDYGNGAVKEIVAAGGYTTVKTLISGVYLAYSTAVDGKGDLFFSDYHNNEVKELVAVNGTIPATPKLISIGGGFDSPEGVAVDGSGNVFVADYDKNAVEEILAAGGYTITNTLAIGFGFPDGVALDGSGNVFVNGDGTNTLREVAAVNGSIPASASVMTLGGGYIQTFNVAADGNDNLYVADRGNNTVEEIQTTGGNFGQVNVGTTTSSSLTLSFVFDTGGTLSSIAVLTQGAAGTEFTYAGGTCGVQTSYSAGSVCTVNVNFTPSTSGPRYGAVVLGAGNGSLVATGPLQGIGVGPQATFAANISDHSIPADSLVLGSGFSGPGGVALDGSGNVFVADSNHNAVKEIVQASGWTTVNTLGSGFNFNFPNGMAVDGSGNVFVADTYNDAVKEIVATGGYTTLLTLGSGFSDPYAVAVDGSGNVFVADFANNAVKEMVAVAGSIPASPTIRTLASGLNGPDGVAVDGNGDVFVASYGDSTVREIEAVNGSIPASPNIKTIGSGFSSPSNLSVDGIGNVIVSDAGNSSIKEIVAAGGYSTVITLGSGFNSPEAVAAYRGGNVVVADTNNNAIDFLDFSDTPSLTFANTPVGLTSGDSPQTVTVSNDGNAALIFPLPVSGANPSIPANFGWDASSTCLQTTASSSTAFELAAGESCTMAFDFNPTTTGGISGNAVLTDNNLNQANATRSIQLNGTGLVGSQTINFTQPSSPAYFGITSAITLIATGGGSSNPVVFSIVAGPGSLSGTNNSILTVTGSGTIVVAANQAGDTNYSAAPQVIKVIVVDQPAVLTSPAPGSALAGPGVTFTWTAATGSGNQGYWLFLGTTGVGSKDLYDSGQQTATSATFKGLPSKSETIYARVYTKFNGTLVYNDYTYTSVIPAVLTSPAPGSALVGPSVTFTWSAGIGPGNQGYWLFLGTMGAGSKDLYDSGQQTASSATFKSLPNKGETIYVRVYTKYNGTLVYNDYTYSTVTQAVMTSPTPGSTLSGASQTFTWTAASGPGNQGYWLFLGTTGAGSKNLYDSGQQTATSATFNSLPTNGATIYARVYTKYNGTLVYNDYIYTAK